VLFPVIDEQTLADLVKELKSNGPAYRQHVSTVMRASYKIESRLRKEGRNDQIEQRKRSKEKDRRHSSVNNLSRYCE